MAHFYRKPVAEVVKEGQRPLLLLLKQLDKNKTKKIPCKPLYVLSFSGFGLAFIAYPEALTSFPCFSLLALILSSLFLVRALGMFASVITALITGSAPHPLWSSGWQKWSSPACATPSPNSPSLDVLWWLLPRALCFSSWDCRVSLRFCRSTVTSTAWVWHHWPAITSSVVCVCDRQEYTG